MTTNPVWKKLKGILHTEKEGRKTIGTENTGKSNITRRLDRQRRTKNGTPQKTHKPANTNRGKMKNNNSINQKTAKLQELTNAFQ